MNHVRHSNIFTVPPYFNVGIAGAGGLGAMTALIFAKMGVQFITVWDDDIVSDTNIATQLHQVQHTGSMKVDGLQQTLEAFSDEIHFQGIPGRITEETDLGSFHLFVSAVDSITARHQIWLALQSTNVGWYIDARMAAEKFDMFVVNMSDLAARGSYEEMLMKLDDSIVPELTCTAKATFHCASAAAANMGAVLRNIVRREQQSLRVLQYIPEFRFQVFGL